MGWQVSCILGVRMFSFQVGKENTNYKPLIDQLRNIDVKGKTPGLS